MRAAIVLVIAAVAATVAATTPTAACTDASTALKTCALPTSTSGTTSGKLSEECCASYRTTLSSCGGLAQLITSNFYTSLEDMGKILERTGDCRGTDHVSVCVLRRAPEPVSPCESGSAVTAVAILKWGLRAERDCTALQRRLVV
jgi:hypothetical protein